MSFILNSKLRDGFIEATVSGSYEFDWALGTAYKITVTGTTTFTEKNTPSKSNQSENLLAYIKGAGHAITIPTRWDIKKGDYGDGSLEKQFVVNHYGINGNRTFINDVE